MGMSVALDFESSQVVRNFVEAFQLKKIQKNFYY